MTCVFISVDIPWMFSLEFIEIGRNGPESSKMVLNKSIVIWKNLSWSCVMDLDT